MASNKNGKLIAEKLIERTRKLLEEKGRKPLETAKKLVLEQKLECSEIHKALQYFMIEYWRDLTTPTLLSLSCEAVGGDVDDVDNVESLAVPLIMISGAIDIHDDIIDRSKIKDGRATVVGKFGQEVALIVGDLLLGRGFILFNENCGRIPNAKFSLITENIESAFSELADAESLEFLLQKRKTIKTDEYLHIIRKKAADIEGLMRIGAIIGGGSEKEIKALGKYGRCLGMLSILRDDLVDLMDFREIKHRIKYECLPFPLIYAFQNISTDLMIGSASIGNKEDIIPILEAAEKSGGLKHCKEVMYDIAKACYATLEDIRCQKDNLTLLVNTMLQA